MHQIAGFVPALIINQFNISSLFGIALRRRQSVGGGAARRSVVAAIPYCHILVSNVFLQRAYNY